MIEPLRARQHDARLGLAGQEHAVDVDVVDASATVSSGSVSAGFGVGDAGIVDGDRQRAELGSRCVRPPAPRSASGRHRPGQHQRLAARAPRSCAPSRRSPPFEAWPKQATSAPASASPMAMRLADAAAGAGDERDLAVESNSPSTSSVSPAIPKAGASS